MRRYLFVFLLALAGCAPPPADVAAPTAAPTATPVAPPASAPGSSGGEFREELAMEHVRVLSVDIGPRFAGTEGDDRAAAYIRERMEAEGYETRLQEFPLPQGGVSWNVIGVPVGWDPAQSHLLVGAHYDSLNGPGANDNASGVGVVLEVGRALAAEPAALPVVLVAFGAEEMQPAPGRHHHIGSRHYVRNMDSPQHETLVAMLSIDMVGRGEDIVYAYYRGHRGEAYERLGALVPQLGIPARGEEGMPNWSDHGEFAKAGFNAAWLWSGEDEAYHSVRDTFDRVQPDSVGRAGRLTLGFVRSYG